MSFFAVLQAEGATKPAVEQLHINVWCMGGLTGYQFVVDVGISLRAPADQTLQTFELALPFETDPPEDLRSRLSERTTAELLFDRPVETPSSDELHFRADPNAAAHVLTIYGIDTVGTKLTSNRKPVGISIWTVKLDRSIPAGSAGYLRLRFRVSRLGRAWQWNRSVLAKNGAVVDLRINDLRATVQVGLDRAVTDRIVPISLASVFVIVPSKFQATLESPIPRYVRALEGDAWQSYLGRRLHFFARTKSTIYYQRAPGHATPFVAAGGTHGAPPPGGQPTTQLAPSITVAEPFRAFLSLARRPPIPPLAAAVRVTTLIAVLALVTGRIRLKPGVHDAIHDVGHVVSAVLVAIGVVSVASLLTWLVQRRYEPVAKTVRGVRSVLQRLSNRIYRA